LFTINPTGSCTPGGLYFTTANKINEFLKFGLNIAVIELCTDAKFYIDPEGMKFKTNKFIIKEILPQTDELCRLAVQQDGLLLQYVRNQTDELCRLAVQQDGRALQYVRVQTKELCRLAVQQDGRALQYVQLQTENGLTSNYVQKKTKKLFEPAVQHIKQNDRTLHYVQKQTNKNCKPAVRQKWK
jgi:hypothetical protein